MGRNLESENRSLKNKLAAAEEARHKTADNLTTTGAAVQVLAGAGQHAAHGLLSHVFGSHSGHDG